MRITGTFLDEISHDIPHQNWGRKEWDADFAAMKKFGINTVILIRCGWKRWMTFPSEVLLKEKNGFRPPVDLLDMFLELAEKYEMDFFCGTYDSGNPWWEPDYQVVPEVAMMRKVCEEIIDRYGKRKAFKGWYLSQEIGGSKAITGRDFADGEKYQFQLIDEDGKVVQTVSNAAPVAPNTASAAFQFDTLKFTKAGTYKYTVKEVIPDEGDRKGGILRCRGHCF